MSPRVCPPRPRPGCGGLLREIRRGQRADAVSPRALRTTRCRGAESRALLVFVPGEACGVPSLCFF